MLTNNLVIITKLSHSYVSALPHLDRLSLSLLNNYDVHHILFKNICGDVILFPCNLSNIAKKKSRQKLAWHILHMYGKQHASKDTVQTDTDRTTNQTKANQAPQVPGKHM